MNTYAATDKGPLKITGYIDPDDTTIVQVFYSAPEFVASTVYHVDDVVRPTVDTGYYYTCTTTGVAGVAEPTWTQSSTTSGTVVFTASSWDLFCAFGEDIVASAWTATNSVTLSASAYNVDSTSVRITPLPEGVTEFTLTNVITKSNGESLSRSFKFKVNEQ